MDTKPLESLGACLEALDWLAEQKSAAQAWRDCQRGAWMLWLVGRLSGKPGSVKRKKLVLAACECARLSLKYVPDGEDRPRVAIETAERWARDEGPTLDDVRTAAAAYAAARGRQAGAWAAYTASTAHASALSTCAAASAASAAAYAASAASAVSAAAYAAHASALSACADIVRKHHPRVPRLGGK